MTKTKLFIGAVSAAIVMSGIFALLPVQTQPQPAGAAEQSQSCPANTDKGAYHQIGTDKQTGEPICKFTYFNACPYFEGAEAGTPECEKGKPTEEQLKPWKPEQSKEEPKTVNQCGGK